MRTILYNCRNKWVNVNNREMQNNKVCVNDNEVNLNPQVIIPGNIIPILPYESQVNRGSPKKCFHVS